MRPSFTGKLNIWERGYGRHRMTNYKDLFLTKFHWNQEEKMIDLKFLDGIG